MSPDILLHDFNTLIKEEEIGTKIISNIRNHAIFSAMIKNFEKKKNVEKMGGGEVCFVLLVNEPLPSLDDVFTLHSAHSTGPHHSSNIQMYTHTVLQTLLANFPLGSVATTHPYNFHPRFQSSQR